MRRFLPEWTRQQAVLLCWPHSGSDWLPYLEQIEPAYGEFAAAISRYAQAVILHPPGFDVDQIHYHLKPHLHRAPAIHLLPMHYHDTWIRDFGPLTVVDDSGPGLLDFRFNAWGGKYDAELDDAVTGHLCASGYFGDTPCHSLPWVLEGGSVESDGLGTVLTTEACLIQGNRNPQLDRAGVETMLRNTLGARRVLWLQHGALAGDDTDSHIDTLVRFCDPHTLAYVSAAADDHEHAECLAAMVEQLQQFRTSDGAPYRLVELPLPPAIHAKDGQRLPATYANFLILNEAVIWPSYGHTQADELAQARLQQAFPHHRLIAVDARAFILQYGSLHCASMQIPAEIACHWPSI